MVRLGRTDAFGHGLTFGFTSIVLLVAEPIDVDALLREDVPGVLSPEHWRISADRILDVASLGPTPSQERSSEENFGPFCEQFTHEKFARGWAPVLDSRVLDGSQRPVIRMEDGRNILLRTRVSQLDFFAGPMTPGFIPEE